MITHFAGNELNHATIRYNELRRLLTSIFFKMLTNALHALENDDLIIRNAYPQVPPKAEYSLQARGQSLIAVMNDIWYWGEKQVAQKQK